MRDRNVMYFLYCLAASYIILSIISFFWKEIPPNATTTASVTAFFITAYDFSITAIPMARFAVERWSNRFLAVSYMFLTVISVIILPFILDRYSPEVITVMGNVSTLGALGVVFLTKAMAYRITTRE